MTKKHFVLIAQALSHSRPPYWKDGTAPPKPEDPVALQWFACVYEVANMLSATNPRFDRKRFVDACKGA